MLFFYGGKHILRSIVSSEANESKIYINRHKRCGDVLFLLAMAVNQLNKLSHLVHVK